MRVVLALTVLGLVVAPAADAKRVKVRGGKVLTVRMCEATRAAHLVKPGQRIRLRNPDVRGRMIVSTCEDGRWIDPQRLARGRARIKRGVGDYRIRVQGARVKPAYVRAGIGELVDAPFTVQVNNVNRSLASCGADGTVFGLLGHLTAPRAALERADRSVSLFLHGLGYGEFFWRLDAVKGYDTGRQLALAGHAVVTIDRPGYLNSKARRATGFSTCVGSQADMAHQVVQALRTGRYNAFGTRSVAFGRVALVGHSAGGLIAELAAASFGDVDALGVLSYADQGQSPLTVSQLSQQSFTCAAGGDPQRPGYAPFGATEADFRAAHLNAPTDPRVVRRVLARRTLDPCGDIQSASGALLTAQAATSRITGPVLVMAGTDDALFPPSAIQLQAGRYPGADVTVRELPETGHALTLGLSAPAVRDALSAWLTANQF